MLGQCGWTIYDDTGTAFSAIPVSISVSGRSLTKPDFQAE